MKLMLIFIVLDVLTLLAYPVVFTHARLRRILKPNGSIRLANFVIPGSITPGK
jgi:hypothetical protein